MVHPSTHSIKKGRELPKGAIPLAKFSNNINKSIANKTIISTSSEKNTTESKIGKRWITLNDLPSINQSLFPKAQYYSDEYGFFGEITLANVTWKEKSRDTKREISVQKQYTVTSLLEIPKSIKYGDSDGSGTLYINLNNDNITKNVTNASVIDYKKNRYIAKNYLINNGSISTISNDYTGQISNIGKIDTLTPIGSTISTTEITVQSNNGKFAPSTKSSGKTYYFTNRFKQRTVNVWKKHYGICRYWGGGSTSSNNYYGDPDYRFNIDNWTAKGHMDDALPAPTQQRWGHWIDRMSNHFNNKYPVDTGGYWDREDGEYDGVKWTFDIEEAAKYGGSTDPTKGGIVWASQYWSASGEAWPPPGYAVDAYNDSHIPLGGISAGSSGTINHTTINWCVKAGAQKTSAAGYYNVGGWYCKWFRDVIIFYKGLTTGHTHDGIYSNATLLNKGYSKKPIYNFAGYITKNFFKNKETINSYNVTVNYKGIINKTIITYDAIASYEGIVYKKIFINDIKRNIIDSQTYIQGASGYLTSSPLENSTEINSNNVLITNISYNGTPLFYTAKLLNQIKIPSVHVTKDILGPEHVKLIYDGDIISNINYVVKITNSYQDNYYIEIISDIPFGVINKCKVRFINNSNEFVEETLYSELLLKSNLDYSISNKTIHINEPYASRADERVPVTISFNVSTTDGEYTSKTITAKVFNKKYALFDELNKYYNEKYIISPKADDGYMTAMEIVAYDNNVPISSLDGCSFKITNVSASGDANVYTDVDGNGLLYCSTKVDTGYSVFNTALMNVGEYNKYTIQKSINGEIYNGYHIKLLDQKEIGLINPNENHELINWYLRVAYSSFDIITTKNDVDIKAEYDIPEYLTQTYSELGLPYIDCAETPTLINSNTLKVKNSNIYINTNRSREILNDCITVYNKTLNKNLTVVGFDLNGYIVVKETVLPQYKIRCSYSYAEENYIYKGYQASEQTFAHLDVNPNMYHSYVDPVSSLVTKSYNLFNKTIYFFLKPYKITNNITHEIIESNHDFTLYHKIDDSVPIGQFDILIGVVTPTPLSSIKNTSIEDIRRLGGGVKDEHLSLNEGVFDIPNSDGIPVPTNNTIVIKLKKTLLPQDTAFEDIEKVLKKHMPVGTVCIIEYV